MNRRDFFKLLVTLPFFNRLAAASPPAPGGKSAFTLKQRGPALQVKEGSHIKVLDTCEIFLVTSVTDSSDRFGNPVKVIKIVTP